LVDGKHCCISACVCELAPAAMRVVLVAIPALLPRSLTHAYPRPASHHGKRCKSPAVFFQSFKFTRRVLNSQSHLSFLVFLRFSRKIHAESLFCRQDWVERYLVKCSIGPSVNRISTVELTRFLIAVYSSNPAAAVTSNTLPLLVLLGSKCK